ncbi:hypothetical protein TNCV_4614711 [Trichonephila clavipes]|nr:hypothetical protein TNCV_4614711 [Trichonephila clavipes]
MIEPLANQLSMMQMHRLKGNPIKVDSQICELTAKRDLTKTITGLRHMHFRSRKFHKEGVRTCCPYHCASTPLLH